MSAPVFELLNKQFSSEAIQEFIRTKAPHFTYEATRIFVLWLLFQGVLYAVLPSKIGYGQRTPAGYLLPYKVSVTIVFGS